MLDFIVVGLPRSNTTWCANWLSTDTSICLHDPIAYMLPEEMDVFPSSKKYRGISCTASWMWKDWFYAHSARKLIIDRDINEINESLVKMGMDEAPENFVELFKNLEGKRIDHKELFDNPKEIWDYLLPEIEFDAERHAELAKMNIQTADRYIVPDADNVRRAMCSLREQFKEI